MENKKIGKVGNKIRWKRRETFKSRVQECRINRYNDSVVKKVKKKENKTNMERERGIRKRYFGEDRKLRLKTFKRDTLLLPSV